MKEKEKGGDGGVVKSSEMPVVHRFNEIVFHLTVYFGSRRLIVAMLLRCSNTVLWTTKLRREFHFCKIDHGSEHMAIRWHLRNVSVCTKNHLR